MISNFLYTTPEYNTNAKTKPPKSYTNYTTVDECNAGPRYIRSSLYRLPDT